MRWLLSDILFAALMVSAMTLTWATGLDAQGNPPNQPGYQASRAPCWQDPECGSGFCDRGRCAMVDGAHGRLCDPEQEGDAKLAVCGAYICLEGRCRSCTGDHECPSSLTCRNGRCGIDPKDGGSRN